MEFDLVEFVKANPDQCVSIFEAGILCFLCVFLIFAIIDDLAKFIFSFFTLKFRSATCLGFHYGAIQGWCRYHKCPYSRQCAYYAPRRTLRRWLIDLKIKFQHPPK